MKRAAKADIIDDEVLYQAFVNVVNMMVENMSYFLDKWKELRGSENPLVRYKAKQVTGIIKRAETIQELDLALYFALKDE